MPTSREFYIGLWMLADDAGFVDWDPVGIGADLYPYRSLSWRTRRVPEWVELLEVDHVQPLPCGRHLLRSQPGEAPNVPRPGYPNKRAHEAKCMHMRGCWKEGNLREGKGRESKSGASPRDNGKGNERPGGADRAVRVDRRRQGMNPDPLYVPEDPIAPARGCACAIPFGCLLWVAFFGGAALVVRAVLG